MYLKHILSKILFILALAIIPVLPTVANDVTFTEQVTFEQAFGFALEHSPRAQLLEAQQETEGQIEQPGYEPAPFVALATEQLLKHTVLRIINPEVFPANLNCLVV